MQSKATTVQQYLASLPEDRRVALQGVRKVILKNLDGYEEGMLYGMIGYYVPHSTYPAGYHCDPSKPLCFAALASQKNYMSLYLMAAYGSPEHLKWFEQEWAKTGKKRDMGKSCIRFKRLDDLALEVIGESIRRVPAGKYIEHCERALRATRKKPPERKRNADRAATRPKSSKSAKRVKAVPKRR